ncbi:hypothetical protein CH35J_002147 [Colletotrichum higginsianum]|uniref:Uncharacterized protein n=1 Tax=Colletotrichum higginsianum TaxID=80884 RepID=A0A4T0WGA5_9PEZI|nr:hypothetical protein CH35J_002147 [Colletotrichum higginsianum]
MSGCRPNILRPFLWLPAADFCFPCPSAQLGLVCPVLFVKGFLASLAKLTNPRSSLSTSSSIPVSRS